MALVKGLKNISILILGAIFLLSASGVVIFRTHCICTGNESLSLYAIPETCKEIHDIHHSQCLNENTQGETTADDCCSPLDSDSGCPTPEVTYFKLINHLIKDELMYINSSAAPVLTAKTDDFLIQFYNANRTTDETDYYSEPPPQIKSTREFLIQIKQLKIPNIA